MKTCPQCDGVFEDDLRFCPRDGTVLRTPSSPEMGDGAVVAGRYEIVRELGRGGMGVVYLANHIKMDRPCALKVLRGDLLVDTETVARFHREARSASRITHPNVVAVHDFGETEDRTTYLAMEFVEGQSLEALLDQAGPLQPRRSARIIWQIANGLNVAHELKIVHRDLKPGNIMLTRYRDWSDFIKVVDFGIAKAFGATSATASVTSTGQVVGTPLYMSPEQWAGPDVDHRSDIYSLAMIAVRMLAGGIPGIRSIALTRTGQALEMIPESKEWPEEVRRVLNRGLEPKADARYDSAVEFAREFVHAVTDWEPPTPGLREPWEERLSAVHEVPEGAAVSGRRPGMAAGRSGRRRALTAVAAVGLVAVGGWMIRDTLAGGSDSAPGAVAVQDDSLAVAQDTSARVPEGPAFPPPTRPDAPRSGGQGEEVAAPPTSAPPSPPAALPVPVIGDSVRMLRGVLDLDNPHPDSARRVTDVAARLLLLPLPDSALVEVTYRLAEARLVLGQPAEACTALRGVRPVAASRGYLLRSIDLLIDSQCNLWSRPAEMTTPPTR